MNNQGQKLSIFISSTCYDLQYVRENLQQLISSQLGYDAILSEYNSFPIDTSLDTIENCLRIVKERADIFVLIIGGRYGYETESGKSITNLEYLQAKSKGIPIYIFTLRNVLSAINIWEDNPKANFESIVQSTKVFEFINTIREEHKGWMFEFDTIETITSTLKNQLSYLFADSLKSHKILTQLQLPRRLQELDAKSLRIVIEKPPFWEYLLFGKVLQYDISSLKNLRYDYDHNLYYGDYEIISGNYEIMDKLSKKLTEIERLSDMLSKVMNKTINEAIGIDGEDGDVEKIVHAADSVAKIYRAIIDWGIKFDSIIIEDAEFKKIINLTRSIAEIIIEDFENYSIKYNKNLEDAISQWLTSNKD
jgi:hypothetical protein